MPNWTTNMLVMHEDDLALIVRDGVVDFGLLRPQPPSLVCSPWNEYEGEYAKRVAAGAITTLDERHGAHLSYELKDGTHEDITNPTLDDWARYGTILSTNEKDYGFSNWYDWNYENWGTKWNACDTVVGPTDAEGYLFIRFDTAWSQPDSLMMSELAEACSHPIYMESSYEGEVLITDMRGHQVAESKIFKVRYCIEGQDGDLVEMDEPSDEWREIARSWDMSGECAWQCVVVNVDAVPGDVIARTSAPMSCVATVSHSA